MTSIRTTPSLSFDMAAKAAVQDGSVYDKARTPLTWTWAACPDTQSPIAVKAFS